MKIIMLGHKRIPSREGGVEIVVEQLAVLMAAAGNDVTVYNRGGHHVAGSGYESFDYRRKYEYNGVHVKTVPTMPQKSLNAIIYSFLAAIRACFSKADIIHFHAEGPCSMMMLPKLFGKKCVATIHGLDWQRAKWGGFATRFLLFGERTAVKYADEIIVLSKGVQDYFEKTYHRKTVFIPNGITKPEYIKPQIVLQKYGLKQEGYLLFLARLVPEKGVHTLLSAYEKSSLTVPLVIAGGSSHSSEYEEQIKEQAAKINSQGKGNVIMTGFVQGQELQELYSNAMLYILPSEIEGMPLSLLEAMSYGNLCLTSDIPENMDVTNEHGLTFPKGNEEELCRILQETVLNITEIRKNPAYTKETVSRCVLERYDWDDIVKRTLAVYESINRQ